MGAQGLRREETFFMVKARKGKKFEARQKRKYSGVPNFQEFFEMFGLNQPAVERRLCSDADNRDERVHVKWLSRWLDH